MTIQINNGNWLISDGSEGNLVNECCWEELMCTGHSGYAGEAPAMRVSIFAEDYVGSENMFWCGEMWTPSQIRAGKQRSICPTRYTLNTGPAVKEEWRHVLGSIYQLIMYREASPNLANFRKGFIAMSPSSGADYFYSIYVRYYYTPSSTSITFRNNFYDGTTFTPPSVMSETNLSINNYRLNDRYFGSYTYNGITYTWMRGAGWP